MSEQPMTDRMVAAMANPHTDILGHCTGRLVVGQGPAGVDVRRRARVRRVRALRQGGRDQLPARAARPADAPARAGRRRRVQGVDRQRRPRGRSARVAALRLRPRRRGGRARRSDRQHVAGRAAPRLDRLARVSAARRQVATASRGRSPTDRATSSSHIPAG